MPRNFNVWPPNNPRAVIRLILGILLVVNLVAAYFVIRPVGGSPDELRQQAMEMRAQLRQQRATLERTAVLAGKVESGRGGRRSVHGQVFSCRAAWPIPALWPT